MSKITKICSFIMAVVIFCCANLAYAENLKPLKVVSIIGRGIDSDELAIKGYFDKDEYLLIGDGDSNIYLDEITSKLKGRINRDTLIYVHAHGKVFLGYHVIGLAAYVKSLPVFLEKIAVLLSGIKFTSKIIKTIDETTEDPVRIILYSCYGGAANNDVALLKKGSVLITNIDPDLTAHGNIGFRTYLESEGVKEKPSIHNAQMFLNNIRNYRTTVSYCESLGSKKGFYYTFKPFHGSGDSFDEINTIRQFVEWKEKEFIERYKNEVDFARNFEISKEMTQKEEDSILQNYFKFFSERYIALSDRIFDDDFADNKLYINKNIKALKNFLKKQPGAGAILFYMLEDIIDDSGEWSIHKIVEDLVGLGADLNSSDCKNFSKYGYDYGTMDILLDAYNSIISKDFFSDTEKRKIEALISVGAYLSAENADEVRNKMNDLYSKMYIFTKPLQADHEDAMEIIETYLERLGKRGQVSAYSI